MQSQLQSIAKLLIACCTGLPLVLDYASPFALPNTPAATQSKTKRSAESSKTPRVLGTLQDPEINESSGLVASRTNPGLYWTHNDSGDGSYIYAIDERGAQRGTWRVLGAEARDWEDIAAGPGPEARASYLYIGDTGDNEERRENVVVYRVKEPRINSKDAVSNKKKPLVTEDATAMRLRYPDGPHDAEALLVNSTTGDIYIVTKIAFGNPVVYEAPGTINSSATNTLTRIAELKIPGLFGGLITGGDISPDGFHVVLCDYLNGYELTLPDVRRPLVEIWQQPLKPFDLGKRKQGESIAYSLDGRSVLVTSEGIHAPVIKVTLR